MRNVAADKLVDLTAAIIHGHSLSPLAGRGLG
jgi:poly-gamma-glutamate capsule biosynthesis protein CapA/YwtB (metallophosphatase superfamily)